MHDDRSKKGAGEAGQRVGVKASVRGIPWFPWITAVVVALAMGWVQAQPEWERNLKAWTMALLPLTGLLVLLGWFLKTKRFTARVRWAGLGCVLLLGAAAGVLLRVDGTVNGTGLPRFAWRMHGPAKPLGAVGEIRPGGATTRAPRLAGLADFPQFMGPERRGVLAGARINTRWTASMPKEIWRKPIGLGWSSFAVVDGRAWTQEQVDGEERVTCLDVATGSTLWSHAERTRFSEWQGGDGPRATPTVHGGRVFAMGGTGILACLDAGDGRLAWRRSVLEENGLSNLTWGTSASPLVVDDLVVVTGGKGAGGTLLAYRVADGSLAWKAGEEDASYASPILATLAGRRVVLSSNARHLTAHDPATGREWMRHPWGAATWPRASQPVVLPGDRVFVSAGYGMGCQVVHVGVNDGGQWVAETLWKGVTMKTQFNSAALHDGHLYGLDDGLLACIDAGTGRRLWKDGRYGSGQTLIVGDTIVVQNEAGPVHVCAASPEGFRELGRIEALGSKTWNHPVVAGRYLLVRNDREATCWDLGDVE
ncbi:MAG: PQQ-binding-like beta-propeller repeat protein [Verrucomicrobiota bacterium]|jgi:outer membrane protein assembly factor BamB